ncbi:hypothetical protein SGPA1_20690 [Streptomyces misionensis JCM 4497]
MLPGRRVPHRRLGRTAGRAGRDGGGRAGHLLDVPQPVRGLAPHPAHRGRRAGPRQRILPGGTRGGAFPHPFSRSRRLVLPPSAPFWCTAPGHRDG